MRRVSRPLRLLDFDCESRPLGWIGQDYVHQEITVIAWKWIGESGDVAVYALTKDDRSRRSMLRAFRRVYDDADMVVGHYIRNFDLPLANAMLVELGEPSLGSKLTQDTKNDLPPMKGISKSQENLSEMFGIPEPKVHMNVPRWREANRLTTRGVEKGMQRAEFDVLQNIALRHVLIERRLLGPPKVWRP
jgi:DNA polymerase elongation subunit (family B)